MGKKTDFIIEDCRLMISDFSHLQSAIVIMDPEWKVLIGIGAAGIIRELYLLFKSTSKSNKVENPSRKLGFTSLIFSILGVIPFVSILGIILGIMSIRKKSENLLQLKESQSLRSLSFFGLQ